LTAGSLSRRYAKALVAIGKDQDLIERIGDDVRRMADLLDGHRALRLTLENPSYAQPRRRALVQRLADRLGLLKPVRNFLCLLVDKNRIGIFVDAAREYQHLADKQLGRVRAIVTAAQELGSGELRQLTNALQQRTGKQVIVSSQTDATLIAGTVTKIGSLVFDGSVRTRLELMREALLEGKT